MGRIDLGCPVKGIEGIAVPAKARERQSPVVIRIDIIRIDPDRIFKGPDGLFCLVNFCKGKTQVIEGLGIGGFYLNTSLERIDCLFISSEFCEQETFLVICLGVFRFRCDRPVKLEDCFGVSPQFCKGKSLVIQCFRVGRPDPEDKIIGSYGLGKPAEMRI